MFDFILRNFSTNQQPFFYRQLVQITRFDNRFANLVDPWRKVELLSLLRLIVE
jgi:hypothetical protein